MVALAVLTAVAISGAQPGGASGQLTPTAPWVPRSLEEIWLNYNEAPYLDHWLEYGEAYEAYFPRPDGKTPLKLLEIGVQSGGSARAWKQYYGEPLTYVGVDINPPCKRTESPGEKIFVEIGSQLDGVFLNAVCDKHGPFDMVIDDGGHIASMMNYSLGTIWSHPTCLTPRAVYAIEDMHTGTMCNSGFCNVPDDVYSIVSRAFYGMHGHWLTDGSFASSGLAPYIPPVAPPAWAAQVRTVHLHDSLAFFVRGTPVQRMTRIERGTDSIPYGHMPGSWSPAGVVQAPK